MNIYIMVDAEGISGIYDSQQVMATGTRYHEGRELMVADINACVEGCKEAGADKIYVGIVTVAAQTLYGASFPIWPITIS